MTTNQPIENWHLKRSEDLGHKARRVPFMIDWDNTFSEIHFPDINRRDYQISIAALSYCILYFPLNEAELTTDILRSLVNTGLSWDRATTELSMNEINNCLDTLNDGLEAFEDDVDAGDEVVIVINLIGLWVISKLLGRPAETETEIQLGIEIGLQIVATMDKPWAA